MYLIKILQIAVCFLIMTIFIHLSAFAKCSKHCVEVKFHNQSYLMAYTMKVYGKCGPAVDKGINIKSPQTEKLCVYIGQNQILDTISENMMYLNYNKNTTDVYCKYKYLHGSYCYTKSKRKDVRSQ